MLRNVFLFEKKEIYRENIVTLLNKNVNGVNCVKNPIWFIFSDDINWVKENVKFESLVNQFASNDLTVISLTFNF